MMMTMTTADQVIPIYTSGGEVGGFLQYPYVFNRDGEWIGWVTSDRQVYSVHGNYVGWLTKEPRIIRKQSSGYLKPRLAPPPEPERIRPAATLPLAPMMSELPIGTYDVLEESPDLLPPKDFGDLREDMD
jgi:4-fold beta flower protein